MNMQNVDWFVKFGIPFLCDADFNDYRETITLEQCIEAYNYTNKRFWYIDTDSVIAIANQ